MLCSMTPSRRETPTPNLDRSPPLPPRLLNVGELAERLGVTERHVRRLVHERRIPFVKWGHLVRFDPRDVAEWLDSARVDPVPAAPLLGTVSMDRFGRPDRRAADLGRSHNGHHSQEAKRTVRGPLPRRR
jgi:excisionase family DNA binding protein